MSRAALTMLAAASIACHGGRPQAKDVAYLTVFVTKDGEIELNGAEASLSQLENALQAAQGERAVVLFAREPPQRERGSNAMLVLGMIRARELRVRLCRSRDFSDAVAPDGRLRPE
jgi:hypothetical protein